MIFLQLWRDGRFPLDPYTLAEVLDVPNFGPPPSGTKNVIERWKAFQIESAAVMAEVQKLIQSEMQGGDMFSQLKNIIGQAGNGNIGRPPSGQQLPKLEGRPDGRQIVSESG